MPYRTNCIPLHVEIVVMIKYTDNTVAYLHGFQSEHPQSLSHDDLLHLPNVIPFPAWLIYQTLFMRGVENMERKKRFPGSNCPSTDGNQNAIDSLSFDP